MDPIKLIKNIFKSNLLNKENYLLIFKNKELKWVLPKKSKYAKSIIKNYRPYSLLGYIYWKILKYLFILEIPHFLYNVNNIKLSQADIIWKNFGWSYHSNPIISIYIGNKGIEQKIVIFLTDKKSLEQKLVIKYPIGENAWKLIKKEFKALNFLKKNFPGIAPNPITISKQDRYSVQNFYKGIPSKIILTREHYKFLGNLVYKDKNIKISNLNKYLKKYIKYYRKNLMEINLFAKANIILSNLNKVDKEATFPLAFVHGDFIFWNIKEKENKELCAYDWEYSKKFGLPFYDLIYYKYQAKNKLKKNIEININYYIKKLPLKLNNEFIDNLLLLYDFVEIIVINDIKKEKLIFDKFEEVDIFNFID